MMIKKLNMLKKIFCILFLFSLVLPVQAKYVKGYYKSNGTCVNGYHRTRADYSKYNNYSTKGNYNPYTGQKGYKYPHKINQNFNK